MQRAQLEGYRARAAFKLLEIDEKHQILKGARRIIDLYERSKEKIINITRSQHAVPLLDILFERPVFSPAQLEGGSGMPSKQMIMSMLGRLKNAGILIVTREPSGRRPQILAFSELVNLCEGHEIFRVPRTKRARAKH